ncbi:MAG: hypothetical protein KDA60_19710, partial [Planctomycetales bacterium]|nr:hypothetical protein [Planctomycetales bacterium]
QTLLSPGPGQAFDPLNRPGTWHNTSSFRAIHTQSPADDSNAMLVGGGIDDRFDFQLLSGELLDNEGMSYLAGSYHAFGNNGTHTLNQPINVPGNTAQSVSVLDALATASDHLPVVADYQIPAQMATRMTFPERIYLGADAHLTLEVENTANVQVAEGADELDFDVFALGAIDGMWTGIDPPRDGAAVLHLPVETDLVGERSAALRVRSSSPGVPEPDREVNIQYTVVQHPYPSFSPIGSLDTFQLDFGVVPVGERNESLGFLFNHATLPGPVGTLALKQIVSTGDSDTLQLELAPFDDITPTAPTLFSVVAEDQRLGEYAAMWTIAFEEEDLPGRTNEPLTLTIDVTATLALPGDANLDGVVDGSDFNLWLAHRSATNTNWEMGDFNRDGSTDGADYTIWFNNRFRTAAEFTQPIPEPQSLGITIWICIVTLLRRAATSEQT